MQKLEELIAALEKADGPRRDLDADILEATGGCAHRETEYYCIEDGNDVDSGFTCKRCHKDTYGERVPTFTASMDAALALLAIVKPGWFWRGGYVPAGKYERGEYQHGWGHISRTDASNCDRDDEFTGWAATPALAILIATLRAKLSQENNNADK